MLLDHAACIAAIRTETERFASLLEACDEDAPIAACPDWRARDLAAHIGEVQRAWAWMIQNDLTNQPVWAEVPREKPGSDLSAHVRAGGRQLVETLEASDPAKPAWTWWGEPATAAAVGRHQLHEVALHRWDLEETGGGEPEPWASDQAADGIDELLLVSLSVETSPWTGPNGVLVIDPDDVDGTWTFDATGPSPTMRRGHPSTYDMRLLGPATDLQLLLWNRPRSFRYRGEPGMLTALLAWPDLS